VNEQGTWDTDRGARSGTRLTFYGDGTYAYESTSRIDGYGGTEITIHGTYDVFGSTLVLNLNLREEAAFYGDSLLLTHGRYRVWYVRFP
jgi:hypothetical protein